MPQYGKSTILETEKKERCLVVEYFIPSTWKQKQTDILGYRVVASLVYIAQNSPADIVPPCLKQK